MPIETDRFSPVSSEVNARLSGGITPAELAQLKQLATSGEVQLVDVRLTETDVDASRTLTPAQKASIHGALDAMRAILEAGPSGQDQGTSMEWIASLDPFARAAADLSIA
jgi:hypothetical protein